MEKRALAAKFQIHSCLDELRKSSELKEMRGRWTKEKIRAFQLFGALKEAAEELCRNREQYAQAKLLGAKEIAHELKLKDIEEKIFCSLVSLLSPTIEEPTYTFSELVLELRKMNNKKFNGLLSLLQRMHEKQDFYFRIFSFPADEQRYYQRLCRKIISECNNISAFNQEEKEILSKIKQRVEECISVLNKNIKKGEPIFLNSP